MHYTYALSVCPPAPYLCLSLFCAQIRKGWSMATVMREAEFNTLFLAIQTGTGV